MKRVSYTNRVSDPPKCECGADCVESMGIWVCPSCGLVNSDPVLMPPSEPYSSYAILLDERWRIINERDCNHDCKNNKEYRESGVKVEIQKKYEDNENEENCKKNLNQSVNVARILRLSYLICTAARLPKFLAEEIARLALKIPSPPGGSRIIHIMAAAVHVTKKLGGPFVRTPEEWEQILREFDMRRPGRTTHGKHRPLSLWAVLWYANEVYASAELNARLLKENKSANMPRANFGSTSGAIEAESLSLTLEHPMDESKGIFSQVNLRRVQASINQSPYWIRLASIVPNLRAVMRASLILPRPSTLNQAVAALILAGGSLPDINKIGGIDPKTVKKATSQLANINKENFSTMWTIFRISEALSLPPDIEIEVAKRLSECGASGKTAAIAALYAASLRKAYRLPSEWKNALLKAGIKTSLPDILHDAKRRTRVLEGYDISMHPGERTLKTVERIGEILRLRKDLIKNAIIFTTYAGISGGKPESSPILTALAALHALQYADIKDAYTKEQLAAVGVIIGHERTTDIRIKWVERLAWQLMLNFCRRCFLPGAEVPKLSAKIDSEIRNFISQSIESEESAEEK